MKISPVLTYYDIGLEVTAFSTTRYGGCSTGNYASFNINEYCGDDISCVRRNRAALCELLGIQDSNLIYPHQTHGVEVEIITADFLNSPAEYQKRCLDGVDALITSERGVCIAVSTADCVPILLYDDAHKVVAAVHSGWRGTAKKNVVGVIAQLQKSFGCKPSGLKVVMGPAISRDTFEVGQEVYDCFADNGFPMRDIADRKRERWYVDLKEANRWLLMQSGVLSPNISISDICTYRQSEEYFSARKLSIQSGRILTGIMMS